MQQKSQGNSHKYVCTQYLTLYNSNIRLPYFRYYKTALYLFLRLFGHSSRPRTLFFLASLELLVRLLFKGVLYSRASYNSGNTVFKYCIFIFTRGAQKGVANYLMLPRPYINISAQINSHPTLTIIKDGIFNFTIYWV